jgi:hypothetical protein
MTFVPLRYLTGIEVREANQVICTIKNGMPLRENSRIAFDDGVNGVGRLQVRTEDTRHADWKQCFPHRFEQLDLSRLARAAPRVLGRGRAARQGPLHCQRAAARTAPCWSSMIFPFGSPDKC